MFFITAAAFSQKIKFSRLPVAVQHSFLKQYTGITAQWEKEKENYEAGFKKNGETISLLYNTGGILIESETTIAVAQLSEEIKNYIKATYNNAAIKGAAKITLANGNVEFEAAIKGKDIMFNENGKFLREIKE